MIQHKKASHLHLPIRTLKVGWHDKDEVMLHAAFQLLVDFVEQEQPDKYIAWDHDTNHRQAWKEIRSLYRWWTTTRPSRRTSNVRTAGVATDSGASGVRPTTRQSSAGVP